LFFSYTEYIYQHLLLQSVIVTAFHMLIPSHKSPVAVVDKATKHNKHCTVTV